MFERDPSDFLQIPPDRPPQLIVTIDTEADFDWNGPYSRDNNRVESIAEQHRAQEIFDRCGIVPTYLVDYAVASDDRAVQILLDFKEAGRCEIGAHLNPWLTPPFHESLDQFHSYPCNLPASLERRKLECLTHRLTAQFGIPPRVYRAGRYGIGVHTGAVLEDLGYIVDMSVVPYIPFTQDGGPSFESFDNRLFWFGPTKSVLEIPVSSGYAGWLAAAGKSLFPMISGPLGLHLHLPGVLARLRFLERIRLTPEGISFVELRRLTENLLATGYRIFSLTYHSPSLAPGNTPYVQDRGELRMLIRTIESYLDYFRNKLEGKFTTPSEIYANTQTPLKK